MRRNPAVWPPVQRSARVLVKGLPLMRLPVLSKILGDSASIPPTARDLECPGRYRATCGRDLTFSIDPDFYRRGLQKRSKQSFVPPLSFIVVGVSNLGLKSHHAFHGFGRRHRVRHNHRNKGHVDVFDRAYFGCALGIAHKVKALPPNVMM